jgi:hypothetical protein
MWNADCRYRSESLPHIRNREQPFGQFPCCFIGLPRSDFFFVGKGLDEMIKANIAGFLEFLLVAIISR